MAVACLPIEHATSSSDGGAPSWVLVAVVVFVVVLVFVAVAALTTHTPF